MENKKHLSVASSNDFPLKRKGNDGNDGGMEARVAKLEADVSNIKESISEMKQDIRGLRSDARTDFRLLFSALIGVAIGLASMMAKGFGWL